MDRETPHCKRWARKNFVAFRGDGRLEVGEVTHRFQRALLQRRCVEGHSVQRVPGTYLPCGVVRQGLSVANIVTYTIAKWSKKEVDRQGEGRHIDLMSIWNSQTIPPSLRDAGLQIGKIVLDRLTDRNRKVQNVTEWAKKKGVLGVGRTRSNSSVGRTSRHTCRTGNPSDGEEGCPRSPKDRRRYRRAA